MNTERKFRKVTLNLFDEDCTKLERWYGHGWTAEVRNRLHSFVIQREAATEIANSIEEVP